jgi:hypothetical protein
VFGGMKFAVRAQAAFNQLAGVMETLAAFQVATIKGDQPGRQNATRAALAALTELLKLLLLEDLLRTATTPLAGPVPGEGATLDEVNVWLIRGLHAVLDWLGEIAPMESINTARTDLGRLEARQTPRMLLRDRYVDPRTRDHVELADREFTVLFTHFMSGALQLKLPDLLARFGVTYDAFRKWAANVDLEQRELMTEAGALDATNAGLPLARAALLSKRAQDVLLRDDAGLFPGLSGLDDEEKLRRLLALARRVAD